MKGKERNDDVCKPARLSFTRCWFYYHIVFCFLLLVNVGLLQETNVKDGHQHYLIIYSASCSLSYFCETLLYIYYL